MNNKIYLGGPDVFRKNAKEHFDILKQICTEYGFIGVSPIDNDISDTLSKEEKSIAIYKQNIKLIAECDIMVMNLNPFRGPNVDDGTAFEIGRGSGFGNVMIGYTSLWSLNLVEITDGFNIKNIDRIILDEYLIIEDFDNPCNLMIV